MNEKQKWWALGGGGFLVAAGLGTLIYFQHEKLQEQREEAKKLRNDIDVGRALIVKTPELEREVIVQRETDSVVAEILPSDDDINNFVRTLRDFEQGAEVKIASLKEKASKGREKLEFERVGYTLTLSADAFQLLDFLDRTETHARFMSVPNMKLSADRSEKDGEGEQPRHNIQLDVETYVYEPKDGAESVKIDSYDRKRNLLLAEISRRRSELTFDAYDYRGARGRRDPFVDPRIPVPTIDKPMLTIPQQIALVDDLAKRVEVLMGLWDEVGAADNLIAQMKARSTFDHQLSVLEAEVSRVQDEGQLLFISAERRFRNEVVDVLSNLRIEIEGEHGGIGPSVTMLEEAISRTEDHLRLGEFELALKPFETLERSIQGMEADPRRGHLVLRLRELADISRSIMEFETIPLVVSGIVVGDDHPPVVTINGRNYGVGEMLDAEVLINAIRENEIEFLFRGLTLVRQVEG